MTVKNNLFQRILKWSARVLLVPALIATLCSIASFATTTREIIDNKIDYTTTIDYQASMKNSVLYPEGGIVSPEGSLIGKITNAIIFSINIDVSSDLPVMVEGIGRCKLKITSEGLWTRAFAVIDAQAFKSDSAKATPYAVQMTIPIYYLDNYLDKIEDDTGIMQDGYIISLEPEINGKITYNDKSFPLGLIPAVKLKYSSGLLLPVPEMDVNGQANTVFPKRITKTFTASHDEITINTLFGTGLPISAARLIFIPLTLLLACYLAWKPAAKVLAARAALSPANLIDRKYKSRIIKVVERPDSSGKAVVEFHTFQELVRMADQKELPILSHNGGGNNVIYFLIDATAVYIHTADDTPADIGEGTILHKLAGKGGAADAK